MILLPVSLSPRFKFNPQTQRYTDCMCSSCSIWVQNSLLSAPQNPCLLDPLYYPVSPSQRETLPLLLEPKRTGPAGGIFWYLPSLPLCHADGSSDDCHSGSPTSIYDSRRFVHSIADGHLGCHQSWAAVNIPVHVCSTCIHTLLHVYTLESGTTEPWSFHT